MEEIETGLSEKTRHAHTVFLEKKSAYFMQKTEEAWDAYTNAYYAWIDAVCDEIGAEHNQRVCAREAGKGVEKKVKNNG